MDKQPKNGNGEDRWEQLRNTIHTTAVNVFGKTQRSNNDWFEVNFGTLTPAIKKRQKALLDYKQSPNNSTHQAYKSAKGTVQRLARKCANDYWLQLCRSIQVSADTGNTGRMYEGIKKAMGPTRKSTRTLKSASGEVINDKEKQMKRWVEHYSDLYTPKNSVADSVLNEIEELQVIPELDEKPNIDKLKRAIKGMPTGKAPGNDGIPAEVIKCGDNALLCHLHEHICQCWDEGAIPQGMKDANIVTLFKNKGDGGDCNNYRGISLMSTVGKVYARVVLNRLQILAERIYPESQCGFRAGRSTIDMIFSLRQLQEKCREQHKPLFIAFIDLTKAFDLVNREGLFKILSKIGCPPKLLSLIRSFHEGMKGTVLYDGQSSEAFDIRNGVKQGCVLAPTLFGIFFSMVLKHAFGTSNEGVFLHTRSDEGLFNLALRATTKRRKKIIRDMLFADDAALVTHTEAELQALMNRFATSCEMFGLTISLNKTNVMATGAEITPTIMVSNHQLNVVNNFNYLGSTIIDDLSLDAEIQKRIGMASSALARLSRRVWTNNMLSTNTKITVYKACVLSTLLYASESWTIYSSQERKINTFHMRCLRRILGITWRDKVTNNEVLERAGIPSMFTVLRQRRLRWLGHVCRMADGRIPNDILYGELTSGKRKKGRPLLRYKDTCKRDLQAMGMNRPDWEELAQNRPKWKQFVKAGLKAGEYKLRQDADSRRERRKQKTLQ
jgi:hypothetical protein